MCVVYILKLFSLELESSCFFFFLLSFRTYWAKPILEFYHISFDSIFMISSIKSESREREKHITHFYVSNFQIVNIYFSGWRTKILHFDMSIIIDL